MSFPCFLENPAPTQICTTNTSNESPIEIKEFQNPIDSLLMLAVIYILCNFLPNNKSSDYRFCLFFNDIFPHLSHIFFIFSIDSCECASPARSAFYFPRKFFRNFLGNKNSRKGRSSTSAGTLLFYYLSDGINGFR